MSNSIFPSGVDTFIDPGPNTPQNAAQPHHLMHSVANDAIVRMETALLQQFVPYAASITPDISKGNVIVIGTLTGNIQIQAPINAASYSLPLVFVFTQDSTGSRAVTWDPKFATTWAPDPTANASSSIGFVYKSSTATWIPVHAFPDQVSITTVSGNLGILGNLTVSGEGFFSGTLNTAGITDTLGITTNGTLTSKGLTVSTGGGNITGNLTVNGSITATGSNGKITANTGLVVNSGGANITGSVSSTASMTAPTFNANLTGTQGRWVGAWNGAPTTGSYLAGDFSSDLVTGDIWVCIGGGSPGIWRRTGEPAGIIKAYGGPTAPAGFLTCDGSPISRTTYAALFAAIGTEWGVGDGTTTFNVPNLAGKVPVGYANLDANFGAIGQSGGEKTHALDNTEMPKHNHSLNTSTESNLHAHQAVWGYQNSRGDPNGWIAVHDANSTLSLVAGGGAPTTWNTPNGMTTNGNNVLHVHAVNYDGGTNTSTVAAHNNLQPYSTVLWVIRY